MGCDEEWEGWWNQDETSAQLPPAFLAPEARPQHGQWHAGHLVDWTKQREPEGLGEDFRSTLISEAAVLSTARSLAVSWCMANIFPNPLGPGGVVNEEQFSGSVNTLDVFMYRPDDEADVLLRNRRAEGREDFESIEAPAPNRAIPVVAELLGVAEGTEYLPIVGNFNGDGLTDLFWYTPGSAPDWLWLSTSNVQALDFDSYEFAVHGEYHPVTGDFDADGDDDILWYRPAIEREVGPSWIWTFDGANIDVRVVEVKGDYIPYVEDFDGDGCTDILWYDPDAPLNQSPLWRCLPDQDTFSCDEHLPTPKTAYPVGFATGGY